MKLLPWLANPGNPAMSSHAEGKKGTRRTDTVYIQWKKGEGKRGERRGTTQKLCSNVEWRYNKQDAHVDNKRPLTAQAYQRWLHACTAAGA